MIVDFKQIRNGVRERFDFNYTVDLSDVVYFDEHIFKNEVIVVGNITNHLGIIKLYATAKTNLSCECARCLKQINPNYEVVIDNVLSTEKFSEDEDDTFIVLTDKLELNTIIIPAIILDVDRSYLCDLDCKGLCPKCGTDLNQTQCKCDTRIIDDRLAVLQKLLDEKL